MHLHRTFKNALDYDMENEKPNDSYSDTDTDGETNSPTDTSETVDTDERANTSDGDADRDEHSQQAPSSAPATVKQPYATKRNRPEGQSQKQEDAPTKDDEAQDTPTKSDDVKDTKAKDTPAKDIEEEDTEAKDTSQKDTPSAYRAAQEPAQRDVSIWLMRAALIAVPLLVLFPFLSAGGIWDPFELRVSDYARRIAVNLFGNQALALADADNSLPTLEQLGKGELPFTSIAAGMNLFGMTEWAGRLPLALWAVAGLAALYWMLSRLMDERSGAFSVVILSTMPLFFVQARTMLGDIVTISTVTMAFAGLSVLVFDERRTAKLVVGAALVALAGIAGAVLSRGVIIGAALPLLAVGASWLVMKLSSGEPVRNKVSATLAGVFGAVGAVLMVWGTYLLFTADPLEAVRWLGTSLTCPSEPPPFDHTILLLGHSLFPWSAFIPFAIGRIVRPGKLLDPSTAAREQGLRVLLIVGTSLGLGVFGMYTSQTDPIPFAAVALLAAIAAVAIRDLERGAPASRALALGVISLLMLFFRDFQMWPTKAYSAFVVQSDSFPDSFKKSGTQLIIAALVVSMVFIAASWLEKDSADKKPFVWSDYIAIPKTFRTAANGHLLWVLIAVQVALVVTAIVFAIGMQLKWTAMVTMSANVRIAAFNAWWAAPIAVALSIGGILLFRDACRWAFPRLRVSRASATIAGGAIAGAILSTAYYPALAAQLSPREVFESYAKIRKENEPIALLGVSSHTASYYAKGSTNSFSDVTEALAWLLDDEQRRWLVLRNDDLAQFNSRYREKTGTHRNLPVLDARSSQILLASNQLKPNETNQNPLEKIILNAKPVPSRPLDTVLENQLKAFGWDMVDSSGKVVENVTAGRKYRLRLYFEVIAKPTRDWESFIHIDGHGRRFNGDHQPMGKKYPMTLWQPGDVLVDDYPVQLEPNFTPGDYMLYYGFFVGNTRMKVTSGKHSDNRVEGGTVRVR